MGARIRPFIISGTRPRSLPSRHKNLPPILRAYLHVRIRFRPLKCLLPFCAGEHRHLKRLRICEQLCIVHAPYAELQARRTEPLRVGEGKTHRLRRERPWANYVDPLILRLRYRLVDRSGEIKPKFQLN